MLLEHHLLQYMFGIVHDNKLNKNEVHILPSLSYPGKVATGKKAFLELALGLTMRT